MEKTAKPFLKWAGGKGQLLPVILENMPSKSEIKLTRYVEPFIGGGAVFFELASKDLFNEYIINDYNIELATAYRVVQNHVQILVKKLKTLETKYHNTPKEDQSSFYYSIRSKFNLSKAELDYSSISDILIEHISHLIFLNRTCFNGLYRQNSKGEFNVPFGDYKNPKICDEENLLLCNTVLQKAKILTGDFESLTEYVDASTFMYLDPPYRPLSATSSFNSYAKDAFNDESQKRLAEWYKDCALKDAKLLLSNSDPKNSNPNDDFFDNLYMNFTIKRVMAKRNINSKKENRGSITELLVRNY
jgi:DNA adenine methylase